MDSGPEKGLHSSHFSESMQAEHLPCGAASHTYFALHNFFDIKESSLY